MRGPAYQDIRYKPAVTEPAVADGAAVAGEPMHGGGEAFNRSRGTRTPDDTESSTTACGSNDAQKHVRASDRGPGVKTVKCIGKDQEGRVMIWLPGHGRSRRTKVGPALIKTSIGGKPLFNGKT